MTTLVASKNSDLRTRFLTAIAMVAVAFGAFWFGGYIFLAFVVLLTIGLLWEWWGLARRLAVTIVGRVGWMVGGVIYIGLSCAMFAASYFLDTLLLPVLVAVLLVIATDVGAYFVGRNVGGPKLWPRVSPNKTWSGLAGGMAASAFMLLILWSPNTARDVAYTICLGFIVALIAQAGDLFESHLKRRAGVKDSGNILPGHGGLFDRLDGLLSVQFVQAIIVLAAFISAIKR